MAINSDNIEGTFNEMSGKVEGAVGNALGDSKTQVEGKVTELKGKAQQVVGDAKAMYEKASETVREYADKAPEQVREAREKAAQLADEASAKARAAVQEQPVAVLAGGIALGFVVGWLLSGRKN
jgi:uncharacterized protein YjbJ (UPF0337 family)